MQGDGGNSRPQAECLLVGGLRGCHNQMIRLKLTIGSLDIVPEDENTRLSACLRRGSLFLRAQGEDGFVSLFDGKKLKGG